MMCSRMPRIYQPAKYLFLLMHKTSKEAFRAVSNMSPEGLKARPRSALLSGALSLTRQQALIVAIGRLPNKGGRLTFDSDKAPSRVYRPVRLCARARRHPRGLTRQRCAAVDCGRAEEGPL